jgi:hypothetical protein
MIALAHIVAVRGRVFARLQLFSELSMQSREGSVPKYPGGGAGGGGGGGGPGGGGGGGHPVTGTIDVGFDLAEPCPARLKAVTTTRSR